MGAIEGVILTPVKIIAGINGDVLHVLKEHESTYSRFGEAYFSSVRYNSMKGWKKHLQMTLNIVVPIGSIKFVLYDDRAESTTYKSIQEVELSRENYQRLTIPPKIWIAFEGVGEGYNLLLNIASIEHDPDESMLLPIENDIIPYYGFN